MADHAHNKTVSSWATTGPVGTVTRGTTFQNRLRRNDRWTRHNPEISELLSHTACPLAIDLGYVASPSTTTSWASWLRRINPTTRVLGLEVDPDRIFPSQGGVDFALGGFELAGHTPELVRAFNVLRQYDEAEVRDSWAMMQSHLNDDGFIIEGTCDEVGRRQSWVVLNKHAPQSLVLAWDPHHLPEPSAIAERLPKILIHRNTPGNGIYDLLRDADDAWRQASSFANFGPRFQWWEAAHILQEDYPTLRLPRKNMSRDNILEIPWELVEP